MLLLLLLLLQDLQLCLLKLLQQGTPWQRVMLSAQSHLLHLLVQVEYLCVLLQVMSLLLMLLLPVGLLLLLLRQNAASGAIRL